jgi:hypothetical protein
MAKGQKRSGREPKKPKSGAKKPATGVAGSPYALPAKPPPAKGK